MYLKEILAIKKLMMQKLEAAVDEMFEQYQLNQLSTAEQNGIDGFHNSAGPDPNYLRPEMFKAQLRLVFEKGKGDIFCAPVMPIPDKAELPPFMDTE